MAAGKERRRAAIVKWNHPCHPHPLEISDVTEVYSAYGGKWRCDLCSTVFDGRRQLRGSPGARSRDPGKPDPKKSYHCRRCKFDVCTACFMGHLHTFHHHRLKKARTTIVYREHDSQWHCNACKAMHSEHTDQLCYHCERCQVDLCNTCFEGTWKHTLHNQPDHTLRPINPSIEYVTYQEWICDNCNGAFDCSNSSEIAFHCDKCNFDLCVPCFNGEKHPFHSHPLVLVESERGRRMVECSNCELPISTSTRYQCRKPSCQYRLCTSCFSKQPEVHPYHSHPLHVCDPVVVYPQSGGMWHCDRCTSTSIHQQPVALPPTEIMYHCDQCEYDLCYSCYSEGKSRRFRPVQVTEEVSFAPSTGLETEDSGYDTYQPYTHTRYYTTPQDYQTRLSRPLVTGYQSFLPQLGQATQQQRQRPPCVLCHRNEATVTFLHNGIPHSGRALCCDSCAFDVLSNRRPCPACRIPPDDIFRVPEY